MKTKAFSLSGIALGNIRNRKRQYLMLSVGIALAIYFISTALLFGFGIYTSLQERELNRYGQQDAILFDCGNAPLDELTANGTLSSLGKAEVLGDVVTGDYQTRLFSIASYDDTAKELSRRRLREGSYPAKAGEIALEQAALAQLRQDAGVGDTITLTLRVPDGSGGFLGGTVEKTYTLTGILYDQHIYWEHINNFNSAYQDIPAGMVSGAEPVEPGGRAVTIAYCSYTAHNDSQKKLNSFCELYGITNTYSGNTFETGDTWYQIVFTGGFVVIIGIILVIACCLGIVNAFSANLDARRRQIGLLRAVGATRKQIKNIFGRETLILSLIAMPFGLGLAVLSVFLIFSWMGEEYVLILNHWVLPGVAVLGVLCITLASRIPLRRASAVSPMQAIRDVDLMRRIVKKKITSHTEFVAPRLIASRSGRIYRRKRAGISAAMAVGILVFTLAVMIVITGISQISDYNYENDYMLYGDGSAWWDTVNYEFHKPGLTEQDKRDVTALPLVKTVLGEKQVQVKLLTDNITSYATGDGWQRLGYLSTNLPQEIRDFNERWGNIENTEYEQYKEIKKQYYNDSDYLPVSAIAVEKSQIEQLSPFVYEGSINIDKLRSGDEVLLVAPKKYNIYFKADENGNGYSTSENSDPDKGYTLVTSQTNDMFHTGDMLTVSLLYTDSQPEYDSNGEVLPEDAVRIDRTVKIGALLDIPITDHSQLDMRSYPDFLNVVTTLPGLSAMGFDTTYQYISVRLSEKPDSQTEEYLNDALGQIAARVPGASMASYLEYAEQNRRTVTGMAILGAALAVLLFAITASMVNNALSAHIRAGQRSIGTLRAVGMNGRDVFKSYFYQMLPLFAWGGGIGLILSLLAGYYMIQSKMFGNKTLYLPVWQPLVFSVLLLAVCAWNIRIRLRSILHESITENIREL